jgi:hypothetical protein
MDLRREPPSDEGLPDSFLVDLLLRHFYQRGEIQLFELSRLAGLSRSRVEALTDHMRAAHWAEIPRRGELDGDLTFALTGAGQQQAKLAFEKCQYVGPAPVTLEQYVTMVRSQSARQAPVTQVELQAALGDVVIDEALLPTLGSALNSERAIYFHGPSGAGKTYLAEHLVKTLQGQVWVPHAIYVDGELIQVFDARVHRLVQPDPGAVRGLSRDTTLDERWVRVHRPVVVAGGELTLAMLELEFDTLSRLYVAPAQMKANNGILVIDDLGRQRVSARELLNRWIVPLDRQLDYLGLHTGAKIEVPFDVSVIFLSNLAPQALTDPAFARRLGYKIYLGALSRAHYRCVIEQACQRLGMAFDGACADFLMDHLHRLHGQDFLACTPYDVLSKIRDRARYLKQSPVLTVALIEWAWNLYFGASDPNHEESQK